MWISVEDRLPETHTTVIVAGGIAYINESCWWTLTGVDYPGSQIQWDVTHWMPLPAGPEESDNE